MAVLNFDGKSECRVSVGWRRGKVPLAVGRRSRCWEDDLVEALVAEKLLCWMGKETMAWVGWAMSCRRSPSRFATRVGQEILHFAVTWDDTGEIQVKTRGLNRIELLSCERRSHRKVGNIERTNRKDSKYAGSLIRRFVACSSHKGSPVIVPRVCITSGSHQL